MCGICGVVAPVSGEKLASATREMARVLHHRGPDAYGVWFNTEGGVALGHTRLSIVDLSDAGSQPMTSACGRFTIVFNGEIYNHKSLRDQLESLSVAPTWQGDSDTETLLAAICHWGLETALQMSFGMFALALWDQHTRSLYLARDRVGEKPLYAARIAGGWGFASELDALLALSEFQPQLSYDAINYFIAYGYVPDSKCIFSNVRKIAPGTIAEVSLEDADLKITPYQLLENIISDSHRKEFARDVSVVSEIESCLLDVVGEQMVSDVPIGCFLSGGIDSSLIASLMQSQSELPVRTFSIGFTEARFNEAPYASAVAKQLGTEHTEFILSEDDALAAVSKLSYVYDEPFADSSQIPCLLLCKEARKAVTVALTGDGGDEVFGGYNRHVMGPRLLARLTSLPKGLRYSMGSLVSLCSPLLIGEQSFSRRLFSRLGLPTSALDKVVNLAPYLSDVEDVASLYERFTRINYDPGELLNYRSESELHSFTSDFSGAEWMMGMDSTHYLPGDILVKIDRAAMHSSLETRAPFLDARVISKAWQLPLDRKISDGQGKQVLRSILYRHVPRTIFERPKQGFSIPLDNWLRGALKSWAEKLLHNSELLTMARLNSSAVRRLWELHLSEKENNGAKLWTVLMLLDWLSHYQHRILKSNTSPEFSLSC